MIRYVLVGPQEISSHDSKESATKKISPFNWAVLAQEIEGKRIGDFVSLTPEHTVFLCNP